MLEAIRHVLVVTAEPAVRVLLEALLSLDGHVVATAADLADGIHACTRHSPDIVIVDLHLPRGSSACLIRALRQRMPTPRIIATSGAQPGDDLALLIEARRAGADLIIREPMTSPLLIEAVGALVSAAAPAERRRWPPAFDPKR